MEYKRLTERVRNHILVESQTDALKYLAKLEDKIAQGTLIELKYPLHKAVYFLRKGAVEEGVIVSFNYNRYTNPKMWYSIEYYIPTLKSYYVEVVKEDMIYPTREEAEKRLRELQGDKE